MFRLPVKSAMLCFCVVSPVSAASLTFYVDASGADTALRSGTLESLFDDPENPDIPREFTYDVYGGETVSLQGEIDADANPVISGEATRSTPNTFGTISAIADLKNGTFKAKGEARNALDTTNDILQLNFISAGALFFYFERFTVIGSGLVTAVLDVDGSFENAFGPVIRPDNGGNGFAYGASLSFYQGSQNLASDDLLLWEIEPSDQGFASQRLSISHFFNDGEVVGFGQTHLLSASLDYGVVGSSIFDFSNTATLSFFLDGGVSIEFENSNFLADRPPVTRPPSAVPLPASFSVLLSGIFLLIALARGKLSKRRVGFDPTMFPRHLPQTVG